MKPPSTLSSRVSRLLFIRAERDDLLAVLPDGEDCAGREEGDGEGKGDTDCSCNRFTGGCVALGVPVRRRKDTGKIGFVRKANGEAMSKEVRYCEHIESQQARPFVRAVGSEYDLVMCWKCQNDSAPYLNQIGELFDRLDRLTDKTGTLTNE